MKEEWKDLYYQGINLGSLYRISNKGRLYGVKTGKIRKLNINHGGYYFAVISTGSRNDKILIRIHRAVAESFIRNENNLPVVNHIDGNKLNNCVDNLEWCTVRENVIHARNMGLLTYEVSVICLNTGQIFPSMKKAGMWAGLKSHSAIKKYFDNNADYCGKHPVTGEKLKWMRLHNYDAAIS